MDCFYEGENFLVINPSECIDCGVCEPECPANAIFPDTELDEAERKRWTEINEKYSLIWPNITEARPDDRPADAEQWDGVPDKFDTHFSEEPGKGD